MTGYNISYSNTDPQCFTDSHTVSGIAAGETSHTLPDLEEGTKYITTVTALLTGGGTDENSATATTLAVGDKVHYVHVCLASFLIFSLTQYFMFCFEHLSLLL